ncbi:MAG TPA: hypothetical protein VJK03_00220, partial [Candidatus Nanoarchaeia archaeon]|nr:hypothetical protein [Candidatus Nanoarchaeia archaeon]
KKIKFLPSSITFLLEHPAKSIVEDEIISNMPASLGSPAAHTFPQQFIEELSSHVNYAAADIIDTPGDFTGLNFNQESEKRTNRRIMRGRIISI